MHTTAPPVPPRAYAPASPEGSRADVDTVDANPFDLDAEAAYASWRAHKLACVPAHASELIVDVRDPRHLCDDEVLALLERLARCNVALYRTRAAGPGDDGRGLLPALGASIGLHRLDANWLADEDGVSRIEVTDRSDGDGRGGFIPYTDRAIRWHTDGYYHPQARTIRSMLLHCVRPAAQGGDNTLLDHELAYLALRDIDPAHVRALMRPDAMTIPAREAGDGEVARAAQTGPVFSVHRDTAGVSRLHMRYTARTRSIAWKDDAATHAAVAALDSLLADPATPGVLHMRLDAGMGIVSHNVLHDRSAFVDDPVAPRLVLRARYLDRAAAWPVPAARAAARPTAAAHAAAGA